jgi:hypothetical protein
VNDDADRTDVPRGRLRTDQLCTLIALLGVAVAALGFDLSIGFLALGAVMVLTAPIVSWLVFVVV